MKKQGSASVNGLVPIAQVRVTYGLSNSDLKRLRREAVLEPADPTLPQAQWQYFADEVEKYRQRALIDAPIEKDPTGEISSQDTVVDEGTPPVSLPEPMPADKKVATTKPPSGLRNLAIATAIIAGIFTAIWILRFTADAMAAHLAR